MLLLGSAWYTEKYRRDEAELEGQLRKLYFRDAQDSKERMPQMTAVIKGESMNLDPRMASLSGMEEEDCLIGSLSDYLIAD